MPILKHRCTLYECIDFALIESPIHVDHQCCTEGGRANTAIKFGLVVSTAWKNTSLTSQGYSSLEPGKDAQV